VNVPHEREVRGSDVPRRARRIDVIEDTGGDFTRVHIRYIVALRDSGRTPASSGVPGFEVSFGEFSPGTDW